MIIHDTFFLKSRSIFQAHGSIRSVHNKHLRFQSTTWNSHSTVAIVDLGYFFQYLWTNLVDMGSQQSVIVFNCYKCDPISCVTQTIETIGVPFPSANEITLEMICSAMMQVKSNKSMTAYQCYIQDTADLRDMKGFDLRACNYIVLCFNFGYTILNCVYQRYEIYKYQTKTYLYVTHRER